MSQSVMVFVSALGIVFACQPADAQKPVVAVKFEADGLPRHFRSNPARFRQIVEKLEEIAAKRLQSEFPLFQWNSASSPPADSAVVIFRLFKDSVVSNRIAMTCSYQLPQTARIDLPVVQCELYRESDSYPDIESMVDEVTQRGTYALNLVVQPSQHEHWRSFIGEVRIASDLIAQGQNLIIPVFADDLCAADSSIFKVKLITLVAQNPVNSTLRLKPSGKVLGVPQQNMQECTVTEFTFGGNIWNAWNDTILEVIRQKKSISVTADYYVRGELSSESVHP